MVASLSVMWIRRLTDEMFTREGQGAVCFENKYEVANSWPYSCIFETPKAPYASSFGFTGMGWSSMPSGELGLQANLRRLGKAIPPPPLTLFIVLEMLRAVPPIQFLRPKDEGSLPGLPV